MWFFKKYKKLDDFESLIEYTINQMEKENEKEGSISMEFRYKGNKKYKCEVNIEEV